MPYDNVNLATFGDTLALGVTTIKFSATFFTRTPALKRILSWATGAGTRGDRLCSVC